MIYPMHISNEYLKFGFKSILKYCCDANFQQLFKSNRKYYHKNMKYIQRRQDISHQQAEAQFSYQIVIYHLSQYLIADSIEFYPFYKKFLSKCLQTSSFYLPHSTDNPHQKPVDNHIIWQAISHKIVLQLLYVYIQLIQRMKYQLICAFVAILFVNSQISHLGSPVPPFFAPLQIGTNQNAKPNSTAGSPHTTRINVTIEGKQQATAPLPSKLNIAGAYLEFPIFVQPPSFANNLPYHGNSNANSTNLNASTIKTAQQHNISGYVNRTVHLPANQTIIQKVDQTVKILVRRPASYIARSGNVSANHTIQGLNSSANNSHQPANQTNFEQKIANWEDNLSKLRPTIQTITIQPAKPTTSPKPVSCKQDSDCSSLLPPVFSSKFKLCCSSSHECVLQ